MEEQNPPYDRIALGEIAKKAREEVRATEEQLTRGRIATQELADVLYGQLSRAAQDALTYALGGTNMRVFSSNLFRNAVNNFNDFKHTRESLNPGYQILFEVDGERLKSVNDIEAVINELKHVWSGAVDVTERTAGSTVIASLRLIGEGELSL